MKLIHLGTEIAYKLRYYNSIQAKGETLDARGATRTALGAERSDNGLLTTSADRVDELVRRFSISGSRGGRGSRSAARASSRRARGSGGRRTSGARRTDSFSGVSISSNSLRLAASGGRGDRRLGSSLGVGSSTDDRGDGSSVLGRVEQSIDGSIVDDLASAGRRGGRTSGTNRRDDGFGGGEPREQARGGGLILGVVAVLVGGQLLGEGGRTLEQESEKNGSSERPVQPVASRVDAKQVHDPPHGDLSAEVGMARVGEQTVSQKSETIISLERLFGSDETVLFGLEVPLLLISDRLDAEEGDEGKEENGVDGSERRDSSLTIRRISRRSNEEEERELEEADEGDVEQNPQRTRRNRRNQNAPAVILVIRIVTTLAPEVVAQTQAPGQAQCEHDCKTGIDEGRAVPVVTNDERRQKRPKTIDLRVIVHDSRYNKADDNRARNEDDHSMQWIRIKREFCGIARR